MTIDYYNIIEAGAVTYLRTELASYFTEPTKQCTQGDDRFLATGYDYFAIAYPGSFPTEVHGGTYIRTNWEVIIDTLTRWKTNHSDAWSLFRTFRAELFAVFNVNKIGRTLNGVSYVEKVLISGDERPRFIPVDPTDQYSDPAFIAQAMSLTVTTSIARL